MSGTKDAEDLVIRIMPAQVFSFHTSATGSGFKSMFNSDYAIANESLEVSGRATIANRVPLRSYADCIASHCFDRELGNPGAVG